jgi:hypothetical protein
MINGGLSITMVGAVTANSNNPIVHTEVSPVELQQQEHSVGIHRCNTTKQATGVRGGVSGTYYYYNNTTNARRGLRHQQYDNTIDHAEVSPVDVPLLQEWVHGESHSTKRCKLKATI